MGTDGAAARFRSLRWRIGRSELLPVLLTAFRIALAPVLVIASGRGLSADGAAILIGAGFFSDVIDGYVARWTHVSNAMIRGFDSFADTIFYLAALYALVVFRGTVLTEHRVLIGTLVATQILEHLIEIRKFGKPASYHAMSAKVWGATLPIAMMTLLMTGRDDYLVLAIVAGFISHADCLAITMVLPEWRHDVATVYDALAIRRAAAARRKVRSAT
jgi:phosphatidylglycerophosphate synthase